MANHLHARGGCFCGNGCGFSAHVTMADFYKSQGLNTHESWSHSSVKRVSRKESLAGRDVLRQTIEKRGFELR